MSGTIKYIFNTVSSALDMNQVDQYINKKKSPSSVVEQPDGQLKSTPFHLRFGKFKALRGKDTPIKIWINDKETSLTMKLGRAGEGYFDLSAFQEVKDANPVPLSDDPASEFDNASMSEDDIQNVNSVNKQSLEQIQEFLEPKQNNWKWIWGNFPQKNQQQIAVPKHKQSQSIKDLDLPEKDKLELEVQPPVANIPQDLVANPTNQQQQQSTSSTGIFNSFMGILKGGKKESTNDDPSKKTTSKSEMSAPSLSAKSPPQKTQKSPPQKNQKSQVISPNNQQTQNLSPPKVHPQFSTPVKEEQNEIIIEMSICNHLIQQNATEEQKQLLFEQNKVTYEQFSKDPSKIMANNNLMFRIGEFSYSKEVGMAMILSRVIFNKELQFFQDKKQQKESIWNRWFGSKKNDKKQPDDQVDKKKQQEKKEKNSKAINKATTRKLSEDIQISDNSSIQSKKKVRKSLKPTSELLKKLELNFGVNTITYKVKTELQGEREQKGNIFLFRYDTKLVISDVDGTITKSDVFGQLMPMMGTDWLHSGIAQLYQSIQQNGQIILIDQQIIRYQLIYLTARAIGQADKTKDFIKTLSQGESQLPIGPVIMSPDRLLPSFKREVIDKKPEVFKIQALKDIRNIFDSDNSMYAGFGNRESDAIAYQIVGIDVNRIYIIDTDSNIHLLNKEMLTSYENLNRDVDLYFPAVNSPNTDLRGTANYWQMPEIDFSEDFIQ